MSLSANLIFMVPTREWLKSQLGKAVLAACEDGRDLLSRDASERSVVFRVGRYLAPVIEGSHPGRFWVDMEFNRVASINEQKVKKELEGLLDPPDKKRSVFPDLIVHDRSGASAKHNLLVAEAKKASASPKGKAFDLKKLALYREQLGYGCAVYIELGQQPRWQWIGDSDEMAPVADF